MDIEFCKEIYRFEIERKSHLDANVQNLTAGLFGATLAIYYIFTESIKNEYFAIEIIYILLSISSLIISLSAVFLIKGYYGGIYKHINYIDQISDYYIELDRYYNSDEFKVKNEFIASLKQQYIYCASHNARVNDEKADDYFQSRKWFSWGLLPLWGSGIVYVHMLLSLRG